VHRIPPLPALLLSASSVPVPFLLLLTVAVPTAAGCPTRATHKISLWPPAPAPPSTPDTQAALTRAHSPAHSPSSHFPLPSSARYFRVSRPGPSSLSSSPSSHQNTTTTTTSTRLSTLHPSNPPPPAINSIASLPPALNLFLFSLSILLLLPPSRRASLHHHLHHSIAMSHSKKADKPREGATLSIDVDSFVRTRDKVRDALLSLC
jgi:hypothetical protein